MRIRVLATALGGFFAGIGGATIDGHVIGRGELVATYERPGRK